MYVEGHTVPNHPSTPIDKPAHHEPHKRHHHPAHIHRHGKPSKPMAHKPAHQNRVSHPRPVGRRSAGRGELLELVVGLDLIGLKIGGHIQ